MATQITATLPTLNFPREVDYPTQEDWAAFSAAAELNFGILGGGWSTQMQLWKTEANEMSIELNNNSTIAQSVANYQGDWVSQGYTLGQTVSVSGVYYICKLTHATGQNPTDVGSIYWNLAIGNWNLKVDTNMSGYASKTTPIDADLIPLSDSASSFGIKKLTWANIKATLKTYFDTLYKVASSETTSGIIELATTAEAQAGTDDLRAITPLKLKNSVLGLGQTWQDLTASRVLNTTYTNSTGKPIQLAIDMQVAGSSIATLTIGANTFFYRGSTGIGISHTIELIVQNGVTYNLSSSNMILNKWQELR